MCKASFGPESPPPAPVDQPLPWGTMHMSHKAEASVAVHSSCVEVMQPGEGLGESIKGFMLGMEKKVALIICLGETSAGC